MSDTFFVIDNGDQSECRPRVSTDTQLAEDGGGQLILEGNNDHLSSTPLLAADDRFMELEQSREYTDILSTQKKTLTWDKITSNFKIQWLDPLLKDSDDENEEAPDGENYITSNQNDTFKHHHHHHHQNSMNASIVAVFLRDYECSRPCSLSPNLESITPLQLEMYNLRFSFSHQFLVYISMVGLFLASFFEGEWEHSVSAFILQMIFTALAAAIFTIDIVIRGHYDDDNLFNPNLQTLYTRKTRARKWKIPMMILLFAVTLETAIKILINRDKVIIWSSMFKPIAFFYVSSKARDALYALMKVTKIVFKVIIIELFLILSFSAMACHLYFEFDEFKDLTSSFLSLFELSTTAVTPSLWIPVYDKHKSSAFFFVTFLIICVFYMHSLVLSVVFQMYIHAMKLIRERSIADKQEALNLAFLALRNSHKDDNAKEEDGSSLVDVEDIRKALKILRPHYNDAKIEVLIQIIGPGANGKVDFNTFRIKMPKVIQTSLRSARESTRDSLLLESVAFIIAISNVIYVLLLSSTLEFLMLAKMIIPVGSVIVIIGLSEVIFRIRPFSCLEHLSTNRHIFLDSLSIFAGLLSLIGLVIHAFDKNQGLQPLLLGRAIDMIRLLRFSSIFRSIVDRTGDVLPALVGPIALVITSIHIYTYSGMVIWSGAINIGGEEESILPLYDLNNFNDYASGLLTMFNIFVVNDWQSIANVYLYANRYNSPYIVYPFFISANLFGVSILLNVLTAFFVGSFVTKVESSVKHSNEKAPSLRLRMTDRQASNSSPITLSTGSNMERCNDDTHTNNAPIFHVFERQDYDSVIKTITGDEDGITFAKRACELLQTFEKLMPAGTDQSGYLLCCQQTKECFGNRHFIPMTKEYFDDVKVHGVIDEMFSQLLSTGVESIQRDFPPLDHDDIFHQHLILSGSICQTNPPVAMFVASKKWISADV